MTLYGYWRSSSSWRVRIALAYKGLDYGTVAVHLRKGRQHDAEYTAKNALAQVPLLEVEDEGRELRLTQSIAMLEYLEERYPEPALLPGDRTGRAQVRQLTEIVNSGTQPLQNFGVLKHLERVAPDVDRVGWACHFIERGLRALEATAQPLAGRFLVGDSPSFADVVLVPQLYNARRFGVNVSALERLCRVEAECDKLEAFQVSHPSRQPDSEEK